MRKRTGLERKPMCESYKLKLLYSEITLYNRTRDWNHEDKIVFHHSLPIGYWNCFLAHRQQKGRMRILNYMYVSRETLSDTFLADFTLQWRIKQNVMGRWRYHVKRKCCSRARRVILSWKQSSREVKSLYHAMQVHWNKQVVFVAEAGSHDPQLFLLDKDGPQLCQILLCTFLKFTVLLLVVLAPLYRFWMLLKLIEHFFSLYLLFRRCKSNESEFFLFLNINKIKKIKKKFICLLRKRLQAYR